MNYNMVSTASLNYLFIETDLSAKFSDNYHLTLMHSLSRKRNGYSDFLVTLYMLEDTPMALILFNEGGFEVHSS